MPAGSIEPVLPGASVSYCPAFLQSREARDLFERLMALPQWRQHRVRLFGRWVPEPRMTAWFADPQVHYSYSGRACLPDDWPDDLLVIREQLQRFCGVWFNGVLCNLYRDGNDAIGWHSDNERELGPQPVIASLSLGISREFILRRKDDHAVKYSIELAPGSLLLMSGTTQRFWQHALPRRRRVSAPRINLTYRRVKMAA